MAADQKTASTSGGTARSLQRFFMNGHVSLYRLTGGAIGGGVPGKSFLILTTTGRKSGKERDTPLFYFLDEGNFIVIASNGGAQKHPTWWLNLQANPKGRIQVRKRTISVTARQASGEERKRLWSIISTKYQNFVGYQKKTAREIPIVVLTPDL